MPKQSPKKSFLKKIFISIATVFGLFEIFTHRKKIQKQVTKTRKQLGNEITKAEQNIPLLRHGIPHTILGVLKDYIIPHEGNGHHPKALRPKMLTAYVVTILIVKIVLTGSLFFLYPNTGFVSQKISDELFTLTNQARTDAGLAPLKRNSALDQAAQRKVESMIVEGYFSHVTPSGKQPWEFIDRTQYDFTYMGENLAMDFSSAKVVHSAFMQSPTHKANIVKDEYQDMGIAVLVGELFGRDTIVLAQYFGKQKVSDTLVQATIQEQPVTDSTEANQNTNTDAVAVVVQSPDNSSAVTDTDTALPDASPTSEAENTDTTQNNETIEIIVPTTTPTTTAVGEDAVVDADDVRVIPTTSLEASTTPTSTGMAQIEGVSFTPSASLVVVNQPQVEKGLVDLLVGWSRTFMTLMLVIVSLLLVVNIFVKAHIQHSHVIAHSLLVIIFIITMIFTRLHFLEHFVVY